MPNKTNDETGARRAKSVHYIILHAKGEEKLREKGLEFLEFDFPATICINCPDKLLDIDRQSKIVLDNLNEHVRAHAATLVSCTMAMKRVAMNQKENKKTKKAGE